MPFKFSNTGIKYLSDRITKEEFNQCVDANKFLKVVIPFSIDDLLDNDTMEFRSLIDDQALPEDSLGSLSDVDYKPIGVLPTSEILIQISADASDVDNSEEEEEDEEYD